MTGPEPLRLYNKPPLDKCTLVVAWHEDASKVAMHSADYLLHGTGCSEFGEIIPDGFFPMSGVSVMDDVARFPECKFYASSRRNLVIFESNIPRSEWHRFLNAVLDAAQVCGAGEIYTLGAMVSALAHTTPRMLISILNQASFRAELEPFNVMSNSDYETPPGQKPTLSSYLLWLARQRGITAVNLWVPVPYYLVPVDDPRACKRLIYFFNSKFDLGIDFTGIDAEVAEQDRKLAGLFEKAPEIEAMVKKLENGEGLDSAESEKLATEVLDYLKR
jgi:predicted ATP-grasp superfamily ATP-dependent carboligase